MVQNGVMAFSQPAVQDEATIAIGIYKLAVRISIGASFMEITFGWIVMLGSIGGDSGGLDMDLGTLPAGVHCRLH